MKLTDDYVAFGALLVITSTGLAIIVIGACLLSWAAYLSMWMPSWVWLIMTAFTVLGVAITATSTAAAVATLSPKINAAHKCLVLLIMLLALEIAMSALGAIRQPQWSVTLHNQVQETMLDTLYMYSTNLTSQAMWDEIQTEVACCGVSDYTDWFTSGFSDGLSVPDTCCLLIFPGCGMDVLNMSDAADQIDTKGCLPVLSAGWASTYRLLTRQALLPIYIVQVIMVTVLVLTYRRAGRLNGHLPLRVTVHNPVTKVASPQYHVML